MAMEFYHSNLVKQTLLYIEEIIWLVLLII